MGTVARAGIVAGTVSALLAGAGTATAAEQYNDSGSALVVDTWYARDGAYGSAWAWQEQNGATTMYLFEQTGDWVQCAGAGTKKTTDDVYGFVGTLTSGEGPASVTMAPRYASGSATGTVYAFRDDVDDCAGTYETTEVGPLTVRIDLAATGPVATTRDRGSFHQPSEYHEHYSFSFTRRDAAGTVDVGGVTGDAYGVLGKTTWRHHVG